MLAAREENGEGQVFMGTHNSCSLLKLPLENGLRRLARNLSKFPERIIYSCPGRTFPLRITNLNSSRVPFYASHKESLCTVRALGFLRHIYVIVLSL
jgi:hypothetical protein